MLTGVWVMVAASWADVGLFVGVLVGIPVLLLLTLIVLDRRAG